MGLAAALDLPVPLRLAGASYRASCLRLCDCARLEALAARAAPAPGDPLPGPAGADRTPYRRALRAAYDAALRWPPAWGDEVVAAYLDTAGGAGELLYLCLRRTRPRPDRAHCLGLAGRLSAEEWAALDRVAHDLHPFHGLSRLVDVEVGLVGPPPRDEAGLGWSEALWALARRARAQPGGAAFRRLSRLTLAQARWSLSRGKGHELADAPANAEAGAARFAFHREYGDEQAL